MVIYFSVELEYKLYFRIVSDKIFITVPTYDIYDQYLLNSLVCKTKFKCSYYIYIFEYDMDISEQNINIYNRLDKTNSNVILSYIGEEEYRRVGISINRKEILKEQYSCTTEIKPFYKYYSSDIIFPFSRFNYDINTNELEKVKMGIRWLHERIKHCSIDGFEMHKSASEIFIEAYKGNRRLNCRNMAVVLCAVYSTMSLKSRYIICLQKENKIDNCHFVVEVYVPKWNKWILVDSSYGLLFKDVNNQYLSLKDVRNHVAEDKHVEIETIKLKINDKLYWRSFIKKIYRFRRPLILRDYYDNRDKFVELVPCLDEYELSENIILIDNEDVFWLE